MKIEVTPEASLLDQETWIQAQPHLNGSRIGLWGISRGGELALLYREGGLG